MDSFQMPTLKVISDQEIKAHTLTVKCPSRLNLLLKFPLQGEAKSAQQMLQK